MTRTIDGTLFLIIVHPRLILHLDHVSYVPVSLVNVRRSRSKKVLALPRLREALVSASRKRGAPPLPSALRLVPSHPRPHLTWFTWVAATQPIPGAPATITLPGSNPCPGPDQPDNPCTRFFLVPQKGGFPDRIGNISTQPPLKLADRAPVDVSKSLSAERETGSKGGAGPDTEFPEDEVRCLFPVQGFPDTSGVRFVSSRSRMSTRR